MRFFRKTLIVFLSVALVLVLGFASYVFTSQMVQPVDPAVNADAVVVLTGGDKRIEEGLALLAHGRAGSLFISGVHKDVTEGEIRAMWKDEPPLPVCCIELGRHATTTIENARETKEWIKDKQFTSIILVTANYHMLRAEMELSHAMPKLKIYPYPVVQPDLQTWSRRYWILLLSEYAKIIFRWLTLPFEAFI